MFKKIFGSRNQRLIKKLNKSIVQINVLEPAVEALDDAALVARTDEFRKRYKDGESLDALLPEAFATVREAARRSLGMRHFDTQLVGGMVLHLTLMRYPETECMSLRSTTTWPDVMLTGWARCIVFSA